MAFARISAASAPIEAEKLADDAPECVLLVGVVLARIQGSLPGHAAEDQDARVAARDARRALALLVRDARRDEAVYF